MRHDERRSVFHEVLQRLLYQSLGLAVEGGSSLVEDEDRWVLEDSAGDRESLALTAGESATAIADGGLVTLRHGGDELMRVGDLRRLLHRFVPTHAVWRRKGGVDAESDVIIDRVVEEHGFLADDAHEGAQVPREEAAYIRTVDGDPSCGS